MDLEQLVGTIRHMRAQKVALDYLDEALTKALEADKAVEEANKRIAIAKDEVLKAKADLEQVKAEHKLNLEHFDKICADKLVEASDKAAKLVAEAHIKSSEIEAELHRLEHLQVQKETYLESVVDSIEDAEAKLAGILEEYDSVKNKLAAIKAAI